MFSKLALFTAATMAVFVAAADVSNVCNTGAVQCCNSVVDTASAEYTTIRSLIGLALSDVTGTIGLNCNPITAIGVGSGSSCTAQPACCVGDKLNGLVTAGCSPINL